MIAPRSNSVKRPLVSVARRFAPVLALLGLIYPLACPSPLRGQSPAPCASPTPTTDENSESRASPTVVIDSVLFDTPISLPNSVREQLIAELKQHKFNVSVNWLAEIQEVAIEGAWRDQGFFKMASSARAQIVSDDSVEQHVSVLVHVDEGIQYRLTEIRLRKYDGGDDSVRSEPDEGREDSGDAFASGASKPKLRKKSTSYDAEYLGSGELAFPPVAFPPEELRRLVPLSDGDLFRTKQIREGLDALGRLYHSHGYINFVAMPLTEVDDSNGTISLTLELDEGRQFRLRKTEVYGLEPQAANALKWPMHPGDIFNNELFEDFFTDNKGILPAGASPRNVELKKNEKSRTVDIRLVFPACTGLEAATR